MPVFRPAGARGHVRNGWLDSRHGFSFGHYHDPAWMGWGPLRVVNEDRVAPGAGFPTHGHANMEILSYVLEGALAHRDSGGGEGVVHAGQWQWMGAGHGVEHSEFNASRDAPVHFLQIWIQPDRVNAPPAHAQRRADIGAEDGRWTLLASPDGADGSLAIRQQAWLRGVRLREGAVAGFERRAGRRHWLQVARGEVELDGGVLRAGDAVGYDDEPGTSKLVGRGVACADVLLFDLPRQG